MSVKYHKSRRGLDAIEDDDLTTDAMAMMLARPSAVMRSLIILLFCLIVVALAWSFVGKADVIVTAVGTVNPEQDQMQVYVPLKGQLVDLYVSEGDPVRKGDVLARLNSMGVHQIASRAEAATMALELAQRKMADFPAKLEAMRTKLELQIKQHAEAKEVAEKFLAEGMAKLGQTQRLALQKARSKLDKAIEQRAHAYRVLQQHKRLIQSEGGGGISEQQVRDKEKDYREKAIEVDLAEADLGEFEVKLGDEYAKKRAEINKKLDTVVLYLTQVQDQRIAIDAEELKVRSELAKAQSDYNMSQLISIDNIDENNFLRIIAPTDGIVTKVTQTQIGAQIEDKTPLIALAPMDARKVLEVEIDERDAAFLKLGMPVKLKFNAFPYQKYGFINGSLEYIADAAFFNRDTKKTVYKARVGLDRTHFKINESEVPIRYGMAANAEVVVRKRRLVDVALDPIREMTAG